MSFSHFFLSHNSSLLNIFLLIKYMSLYQCALGSSETKTSNFALCFISQSTQIKMEIIIASCSLLFEINPSLCDTNSNATVFFLRLDNNKFKQY